MLVMLLRMLLLLVTLQQGGVTRGKAWGELTWLGRPQGPPTEIRCTLKRGWCLFDEAPNNPAAAAAESNTSTTTASTTEAEQAKQ